MNKNTSHSRFELPSDIAERMDQEASQGSSKSFEHTYKVKQGTEAQPHIVTLRLLPALVDGKLSSVVSAVQFTHMVKSPDGKWLIGQCDGSQNCPICSSKEKEQDYKTYGAKKSWLSWAYVISDNQDSTRNNTVVVYEYPKAIHDLINAQVTKVADEFNPTAGYQPFNLYTGGVLKIQSQKSLNPGDAYAGTSFAVKPTAFLNGDDDAIEKILLQTSDIEEKRDLLRGNNWATRLATKWDIYRSFFGGVK